MVSLSKLLRIRQGIGKKYKNIGLEMFRLSIPSKKLIVWSSNVEIILEQPA
jgi:hypothetical protein